MLWLDLYHDDLDWLYFQSLERNFYMGDPRLYVAMDAVFWDRANRNDTFPGKHMIEDMNGDNLRLKDLKSGMMVKVKAKNPHFIGYKYLYTSYIGKYVRTQYKSYAMIYS